MQPKGLTNKANVEKDQGVITIKWQNTEQMDKEDIKPAEIVQLVNKDN